MFQLRELGRREDHGNFHASLRDDLRSLVDCFFHHLTKFVFASCNCQTLVVVLTSIVCFNYKKAVCIFYLTNIIKIGSVVYGYL